MIQFIVRDIGSRKLFVKAELSEYFILREVQGQPDLKKFFCKSALLSPRMFTHQEKSPDRQNFRLSGLLLAAIAAKLKKSRESARSLLPRCSPATLIIRDVERIRSRAVAKFQSVPKNELSRVVN